MAEIKRLTFKVTELPTVVPPTAPRPQPPPIPAPVTVVEDSAEIVVLEDLGVEEIQVVEEEVVVAPTLRPPEALPEVSLKDVLSIVGSVPLLPRPPPLPSLSSRPTHVMELGRTSPADDPDPDEPVPAVLVRQIVDATRAEARAESAGQIASLQRELAEKIARVQADEKWILLLINLMYRILDAWAKAVPNSAVYRSYRTMADKLTNRLRTPKD